MLSFIDAYSGYDQITMNPIYASKTSFITNYCNYYQNMMPFVLNNPDTTYQRLMYMVDKAILINEVTNDKKWLSE